MKYSLQLPSTVETDFAPLKPAPQTSYGKVIGGICVMVGCFSWGLLILGGIS